MRYFLRMLVATLCLLSLLACGEDPEPKVKDEQQARLPASENTGAGASQPSAGQAKELVTLRLLPENPTSADCLNLVVQGQSGRSGIRWAVNGEVLARQTSTQLCGDFFKRDDLVTASVGPLDAGASVTVTIGNSPPRVTGISASPDQLLAGQPLSIVPEAEDADGDSVVFTYQWLINGEADPVLTQATLPGNKFTKGDRVQVLIVPNDLFNDGPTYESYAQLVPNATPRIISVPPSEITSLEYRYQLEVSDPDDAVFSFRLAEAPAGMTIDESTGLLQWSLADVTSGDYTITIFATDSDGAETAQQYTLSLGPPQ